MRRRGERFNRGRVPTAFSAIPPVPPEPTGQLVAVAQPATVSGTGSIGINGSLAAVAQAATVIGTGTVASGVPNIQTIMGANCIEAWESDVGVTVATGVSSWLGQVAALDLIQGTGGNQPTYNATGDPAGTGPSILLDGSNDSLAVSLVRAAPGTTPAIVLFVGVQRSWNANDPLVNDAAGTFVVRQVGSSPQLVIFAGGANRCTNGGAAINTWAKIQANFLNSASDRLEAGATDVAAGTTAGNTAGTQFLLGRNGASSIFGNFEVVGVYLLNAVPTTGVGSQAEAIDAYITSKWGGTVVT